MRDRDARHAIVMRDEASIPSFDLDLHEVTLRSRVTEISHFLPGVSMTTRPCPKCSSPTIRRRDNSFQRARSEFYRCSDCGHSWVVNREPAYRVEIVSEVRLGPSKMI